jgi:hypothetical protein
MPIKLSKAMEILELNMKEAHKKMPPDVRESLNLALNCMKTVQFIRGGGQWSFSALFPNEAPEESPN